MKLQYFLLQIYYNIHIFKYIREKNTLYIFFSYIVFFNRFTFNLFNRYTIKSRSLYLEVSLFSCPYLGSAHYVFPSIKHTTKRFGIFLRRAACLTPTLLGNLLWNIYFKIWTNIASNCILSLVKRNLYFNITI